MTKHRRSDNDLLLDASLDFIMNSPDDVFNEYLKETGEDRDVLATRASKVLERSLANHPMPMQNTDGSRPVLEDKLAALSVPQQREIAARLGITRSVLSGFREHRIIITSIPGPFLSRLAAEIGLFIEELKIILSSPNQVVSRQYKADEKPLENTQCTFEQALIDANVPIERRLELLRNED